MRYLSSENISTRGISHLGEYLNSEYTSSRENISSRRIAHLEKYLNSENISARNMSQLGKYLNSENISTRQTSQLGKYLRHQATVCESCRHGALCNRINVTTASQLFCVCVNGFTGPCCQRSPIEGSPCAQLIVSLLNRTCFSADDVQRIGNGAILR